MRILVLGAGGVGGYFGGRLAAAGADVSFLVRPSRAAQLLVDGLQIASPLGDCRIAPALTTAVETEFDVILLTCKAYDLAGALEAVAPAVGPASVVVPLLNGVRHLDVLDARFGRPRVLGGLCHLGVTVGPAGQIEHLNTLQRLALGAREAGQLNQAEQVRSAFAVGGFEPELSADIVQEMWDKFVFLAAYAALTTLLRAPVGAIMATEHGQWAATGLLDEAQAVASASGHDIRPAAADLARSTLTDRTSGGTASICRDLLAGRRTEHDHIIGDLVHRAAQVGVPVPLLTVALAQLQTAEVLRSGALLS